MSGRRPLLVRHLARHLVALSLAVALVVPSPAAAAERDPEDAALDDDSILALAGALGLGAGTVLMVGGAATFGAGFMIYETGIDDQLPPELILGLLGGGLAAGGLGVLLTGASGATLAVDHVFFEE
jgi:hypothetical protein